MHNTQIYNTNGDACKEGENLNTWLGIKIYLQCSECSLKKRHIIKFMFFL